MQFVIGLALVVGAISWFGDKLEAAGVGWDGFAALCVLGSIGVGVATVIKENRDGPQQDAPPVAALPRASGANPAPVTLAAGLSQPFYLRYNDGRGVVTVRTLVVLEAFGNRPGGAITHLRGFCQLRRGIRTFRRERIVAAADPDTGELIEDIDVFLLGRPSANQAVSQGWPPHGQPKRRAQRIPGPWG